MAKKASLKEINEEWGQRFINLLNRREAVILFGFGKSRAGKLTYYMTKDLTPKELAQELRQLAQELENLPG